MSDVKASKELEIRSLSSVSGPFGAGIKAVFDPFGVASSLMDAQLAWLSHPEEMMRAMSSLSGDLFALQAHVMRRNFGLPSREVVTVNPADERFSDPVWSDSPAWEVVREWYLAFTHHLQDMYFQTPGLSEKECRRAAFWLRKWLNAVAPTNFFWANPVALRKYMETHGQSLVDGFRHFLRDAQARKILMVEEQAFELGRDLAITPGKVIYRNHLLELIHYAPVTAQVREKPLLIVTPWINKFYVLDLSPEKSMVRYLLDQGFSVFITSWKNPDTTMSSVSFEDYMTEGVATAVDVVRDFSRSSKLNLAGYCIGGTLVATYMAWANRHFEPGDCPVSSWTLLTALTDFSRPGDMDLLIEPSSLKALEEHMSAKGYLEGSEMASAFRMLRSNSLVWHYWVHSYLYGESLPPFDLLFWNMDTTRMPYAMHSYYLREMYLENNLIKPDQLCLAGEPISLKRIVQPLYAVAAEDDHVAPWSACYLVRNCVSDKVRVRFVLSTSGHVLGIVNPPVKEAKEAFWAGEPHAGEPHENWLNRTRQLPGSWWKDWIKWLKVQSGELIPSQAVSSSSYPALSDAPGLYVLEK